MTAQADLPTAGKSTTQGVPVASAEQQISAVSSAKNGR
jgi:hypothetical protein